MSVPIINVSFPVILSWLVEEKVARKALRELGSILIDEDQVECMPESA